LKLELESDGGYPIRMQLRLIPRLQPPTAREGRSSIWIITTESIFELGVPPAEGFGIVIQL
jgi:hypothetical protein